MPARRLARTPPPALAPRPAPAGPGLTQSDHAVAYAREAPRERTHCRVSSQQTVHILPPPARVPGPAAIPRGVPPPAQRARPFSARASALPGNTPRPSAQRCLACFSGQLLGTHGHGAQAHARGYSGPASYTPSLLPNRAATCSAPARNLPCAVWQNRRAGGPHAPPASGGAAYEQRRWKRAGQAAVQPLLERGRRCQAPRAPRYKAPSSH